VIKNTAIVIRNASIAIRRFDRGSTADINKKLRSTQRQTMRGIRASSA